MSRLSVPLMNYKQQHYRYELKDLIPSMSSITNMAAVRTCYNGERLKPLNAGCKI
jgi:hypothetical protein